ncbi:MAG: ABC transporter permease subunit [Solirubrobacterales bacterium]|nr:ABC transporter permease subunit [Solirubrobacterales bacterium]
MAGLAGSGRLFRFALRRDRWLIPLCVAGLVGWIAMYALSYKGLYGTPAELEMLASSMEGNAAVIAMIGPARAIDTLPGVVVWEAVPVLSILSAILALFLVTRHSRMEEEDGRTDLLLASGAGRVAPLTAALGLTGLTLLLAAAGEAAVLILVGFDAGQSALAAAAILGTGLVFAATTAVCAQVTGKARLTRGLVAGVLGLAWALRAIGDLGSGRLTWTSPLGWAELTHPFSGGRWWVLLLPLAATLIATAVAALVLNRRDIGSGLLQPRPGSRRANRLLLRPLGLPFRIQRGTIIGWTIGLVAYGVIIGSMGNTIEDVLQSSPAMKAALAGGDRAATGTALLDSYFASILIILAIFAAAFTIGAALRPHSEESHGRAELLLASPLGRTRWVAGHLLIGAVASLVIMILVGLAIGIGLGVSTGDFSRVPALAAAGAAQAPAMWIMGGLAVLLFGLSDRLAGVAWALLIACVAIWSMAAFGNLPYWINSLSPFTHTPALPSTEANPVPLAVLTASAAVLTAVGIALFRRRDLG